MMVLAQQGIVGSMQATVDLTYLSDTVLLLRYYEHFGQVKQAISVIKKRSGNHERTIREFRTTAQGGIVRHLIGFWLNFNEPPQHARS